MAASSDGSGSDAALQPFEFSLNVDPVLVMQNGDEKDIDDFESIYPYLEDVICKSNCFASFSNVIVTKVNKDLKITVMANSLKQFNEIKTAVTKKQLTRLMTEKAQSFGLELDLGLAAGCTEHIRLDVSITEERRTANYAARHFTKVSTEKRKDNLRQVESERKRNTNTNEKNVVCTKKSRTQENSAVSTMTATQSLKEDPRYEQKPPSPSSNNDPNDVSSAKSRTLADPALSTLTNAEHFKEHSRYEQKPSPQCSSIDPNDVSSAKSRTLADPALSTWTDAEHFKEQAGYEQYPSPQSSSIDPSLEMQILMYIPFKKKSVKEVFVELVTEKLHISKLKLHNISEYLWMSGIIRLPIQSNLKYTCHSIVKNSFVSFLFEEKLTDVMKTPRTIKSLIRDFFITEELSLETGIVEHFKYLLDITNENSLKDAVMETDILVQDAENLKIRFSTKALDKHTILHQINDDFMRTTRKKEAYILFGYLCALLVHKCGKDHINGIIGRSLSKETCRKIMKSLQTLSHDQIPSGTLNILESVIVILCNTAFPNQSSEIVQIFQFCYPVFSSEFLIKCFSSCTLPFSCDQKECANICQKIHEQEKVQDIYASELLQKFLQYSPLDCTIYMIEDLIKNENPNKKDLLDVLKTRITTESNKCLKGNCIKELVSLANKLNSRHEDIRSAVSDILSKNIIKVLERIQKSDTQTADIVIKSLASNFMTSQEFYENLYRALVISQNKSIHKFFLKKLEEDQIFTTNEKLTCTMVMDWFHTAIKYHCSNNQQKDKCEDLPFVYNHLSDLLQISSVKSRDTLVIDLKEETFLFLRSTSLQNLIENICKKPVYEDFTEVFKEHLFRLMSDSACKKYVLREVTKSTHRDYFEASHRSFANFLTFLMEVTGLSEKTNELDELAVMLQNGDFWIKLLKIKGPHSDQVKKRKIFSKAKQNVDIITKQLKTEQILIKDFKKMQTLGKQYDKSIVIFLCKATGLACQVIERAWYLSEKRIDQIARQIETASKTVMLLDKGVQQGQLPDVPHLKKAREYIQMQKKIFSKGEIPLNQNFLSSLNEPVFNETINHVLDSEVFLTVSKNHVKKVIDSCEANVKSVTPEHATEGDHHIRFPSSVLSVLRVLNDRCITEYKATWEPLFSEEVTYISEVKTIAHASNIEGEVTCVAKILEKTLPKWILDAIKMFQEYHIYDEKVQTLRQVLSILKIEEKNDKRFCQAMDSFYAMKNRKQEKITLKELFATKQEISLILKNIESDFFDILKELSKASSLVEFLSETVKEDLRQLIDSVEEHSDQFIQESTISALVDVKRFLNPVLKSKVNFDKMNLVFVTLDKAATANNKKCLASKINDCSVNVHGLKSLYKYVANRGELTKDIISKAVNQDDTKFIFQLDKNGSCELKMKYRNQNKKTVQSKADLDDLRSRALLLVNTETQTAGKDQSTKKAKLQKDLNKFVENLDSAMFVVMWLEKLAQYGHPEYVLKQQELCLGFSHLCPKIENLQVMFTEWTEILDETRDKYFWLNWFFPEQLFMIKDFFENGLHHKEVSALFEYIGCGTDWLDEARIIFKKMDDDELNNKFSLPLIGKTLSDALQNVQFKPKRFPQTKEKRESTLCNITDVVQEGKLFIAALEDTNKMVIPTLLALYRNTTGFLPMPHQLLFCSDETKWEHLQLFLKRCLLSDGPGFGKQLYCIVGVEKLTNEIQFKLVDELQFMLQKYIPYLAMTCQGGTHHPFLDHFDAYVHHVKPMRQSEIESCFKFHWPDVRVVTSDVAGQGKTEYIYNKADSENMGICSVHINGDISAKKLIARISKLKILPHHVLHIDIGMVSNPFDLDLLLFQMIILGFVVDGSSLLQLQKKHISIEVANSINHFLQNSLQTLTYFSNHHLKWEDFTNFSISKEICSPVQVVCSYLNLKDEEKLDSEDLCFYGENSVDCLPSAKCQHLLQKYFPLQSDLSFSVVNIFLSVLADQLKKLSCSIFFKTSNLQQMLGEESTNVKSKLIDALIEFSAEFSMRSVQACRDDQAANFSQTFSAPAMIKRVESMIQWTQSNHLIVAFHNSDIQTVSALYREKSCIPEHISYLFETQVKKQLPDISSLDQKQLQEILQRVARSRQDPVPEEILSQEVHDYALTPDNLLKMILIILRVKAHIPVIIMGETGCGKTCLIRYLAIICGVKLYVQNIHAGIEESTITDRVMAANEEAKANLKEPVWMFLDEINTCNHLGLINNIICHHICQEKFLAPNLVLMAACNPYRLRNMESILTAGLTTKVKTDELAKLVYRVNPLPESMLDYVWDYGHLSEKDENAYIERMVEKTVANHLVMLLVELLVISQHFMKTTLQNVSCVSLRDISRCRRLISWFKSALKSKHKIPNEQCEIESIILALAHSYHSRLANNNERQQYRKKISELFEEHEIPGFGSEQDILHVIQFEQKDILDRMDIPQGTAKNTALLENVFVIMVCILNRIPVFVVGKPGCSKSLSLQLIKSNLRGKDSENEYFKSLPQLFCVSYQGSESSTSDGIIKVFDKAKRYLSQESDVLPVVILDEIGLAEISRFNPLKVLHSLLEPGDSEIPDVAVVGISNWALDAAKMNRAIHLSRPDMDLDELYMTGISISEDSFKDETSTRSLLSKNVTTDSVFSGLDERLLTAIAKAYESYTAKQHFPNFHGLRDYYSLIKYVSKELKKLPSKERYSSRKGTIMLRGLLRNFGGLPSGTNPVVDIYKEHLAEIGIDHEEEVEVDHANNITSLIKENICDLNARHLLLSTCGDSSLNIIESLLQEIDRDYELIMGSQFDEDLTDDYNYRILSRIILCMEQGIVLILKDLDNIYGSLYDMLNQNYTIVGKKNNCRVALGAYSNPLCHVHDNFRCIVLVEEGKLNMSDPPFLNRFEKQNVRIADILTSNESRLVKELDVWLEKLTSVENFPQLNKLDFIPIFTPDMLASLVRSIAADDNRADAEYESAADKMLCKCKDVLLHVCSPEGIVRIERSHLANDWSSNELKNQYFSLPLHVGLGNYVKKFLEKNHYGGHKLLVFTHSNLHTDIGNCLECVSSHCQIEKLSSFKSEKQLSNRMCHFWQETESDWLVIKCSPQLDMMNFLLMKSIVEKNMTEFMKNEGTKCTKNILIILHLERQHKNISLGSINFLSGWQLAFVDELCEFERPLTSFLEKTVEQLIDEQRPLTSFISRHIFWAFSCIGYTSSERSLDSITNIVNELSSNEELLEIIEELTLKFVHECCSGLNKQNWQIDVACTTIKLFNASTFHGALEQEINDCLKPALAAIVYKIELKNAWDILIFAANDKELLNVWKEHAFNNKIISITDIPPPSSPQCYVCPLLVTSFQYPFILYFLENISNLQNLFLEKLKSFKADLNIDDDNDEDDDNNEIIKDHMSAEFKDIIQITASELFEHQNVLLNSDDYFKDFCVYIAACKKTQMSNEQKQKIIMLALRPSLSHMNATFIEAVTEIHIVYWLQEAYITALLNLVDSCLQVTNETFENVLEACFKDDEEEKISDLVENTTDTSEKISDLVENTTDTSEKILDLVENTIETSEKISDLVENETDTSEKISDLVENKPKRNFRNIQDSKCRLVTYCCNLMIPSKCMDSTFSVVNWQQRVSLVLSLSSEVSLEPSVIHCLRVCNDFACLIVIPNNLPSTFLLEFGENILAKGLTSEDFFHYIIAVLENIKKDSANMEKSLQHFLTCYLSSCMSVDPDLPVLEWTFKKLKEGIIDQTLCFFGPVLHQALMTEVYTGLNILSIKENEFVQTIDNILTDFTETANGPSVFAALTTDMILQFHIMRVNFFKGNQESKTALMKEMQKSLTVLLDNSSLTFCTLVAIAFLKEIITGYSHILTSKKIDFKTVSHELQQVESIFKFQGNGEITSNRNEKIKAMQNMLIQLLVKGNGLKGFDHVKQSLFCTFEFIEAINIDVEQRILSFEHNPCNQHSEKDITAFCSIEKSPEEISILLKNAAANSEIMLKLYSLLIQQRYLLQAVHLPTLQENQVSKLFISIAEECSISENQIKLLKCLSLTEEFEFPLLQISPSSDSESLNIASVLVHLFSLILADVSNYRFECNSVLLKCLENPDALNEEYLFSCPDKDALKTTATAVSDGDNSVTFFHCSCTFVTAVSNAGNKSVKSYSCSVCNRNCNSGCEKTISIRENVRGSQGYSCFENDKLTNHLLSVRRLSPIAFRVLNFFLHGCLAGSLELNCSNSDDLSSVLKTSSVVDHLKEHLQSHWKALKTLTLFGDSQLCKFLHAVIDDHKDLLLQNLFMNEDERESFEQKFDREIVQLVKNRYTLIEEKLVTYSDSVVHNVATELEKTLENIHFGSETAKALAVLFRITNTPSIENMEIEFLNRKMGEQYPFLGLVFEKQIQLDLLSHLLPLVKWHMCTVRFMSHRIKKCNVSKTTLEAFIYKSELQENEGSKQMLLKTYDTFIKSWNKLRDHLRLLQKYNSDIAEMERINKESNLSEILIMGDTSPLYQVMKALEKMHNELLDDSIIISLCMKCLSTSFLIKNTDHPSEVSVLPCLNLENITEKDIISNPLDEDLLKFSQCNTNPGCGLQREYDFYQIEMQVADKCLINKPYIKIQTNFPQVIFSGEMLQKSKTMFHKIRQIVAQKPLNKETERSVLQFKENNSVNLQGLLNYLEMAFNLLTREHVLIQDVDQVLTDFLQQWKSLISVVENPAVITFCSKVHICHIIALYEFVELLMADVVLESLEEKYNKQIPTEACDHFEMCINKASTEFLETFVHALKRFAFRYLSASNVNASEKLAPYLMDSTLWPGGTVPKEPCPGINTIADIVSPSLAVENTVKIIQFVEKTLENKTNKLAAASSRLVFQADRLLSRRQATKISKHFRKK